MGWMHTYTQHHYVVGWIQTYTQHHYVVGCGSTSWCPPVCTCVHLYIIGTRSTTDRYIDTASKSSQRHSMGQERWTLLKHTSNVV